MAAPWATVIRRGWFIMPVALVPGGCTGPLSTLDPAGPNASAVAEIWWVMLAGAAAIFALVISLFVIALLRRDHAGRASETLWLGISGVAFPAVVLTALLIFALLRGESLLVRPSAPDTVTIDVISRQYGWEFRRGTEALASDRLVIPAGRPIDLRVTSEDVIHGFWIPRLGGKIDAIPGHTNVVRLTADKPGIYHGQCAEYCGVGHARMFFAVEALEPALYDALVAGGRP
jgi:cytochrome c oxidase subunit 2